MKKKCNAMLGAFCYAAGVFCALYVGGWLMLLVPIKTLLTAFSAGNLTLTLLTKCIIKIAFSTTFGGFVWCLGYIGYNHFKGTEDPEWDEVEQKWKNRIHKDSKDK